MNNNKDFLTLHKIIERIDRTTAYCKGHHFDTFMSDTMLQEA